MDPKDQDAIEGETPRPLIAPENPKFGGGSRLIIGVCVAIAVLGIFVGIIVVYGDANGQADLEGVARSWRPQSSMRGPL